MSRKPFSAALKFVRVALGRGGHADTADAELLARFVGRHDEAAFAALLERYGPLVLGVCRRVLGSSADADDAFQATFLVLLRKAGSIRRGASVASWLHGVARRVSLEARTHNARRRTSESGVEIAVEADPAADAADRELRMLLDEELGQLPTKYREPLVLHYLAGRTKEETARELGWAEGTVSGRLARARDLLRDRLTRRGVAPAGGAAAALAPDALAAAVPAALGGSTASLAALVAAGEWAAGADAARVLALAGGIERGLFSIRVKAAVAVLLAATAVGLGSTGLLDPAGPDRAADPAPGLDAPAPGPAPAKKGAVTEELLRLTGPGAVGSVAVSADGKRLLTCSNDNTPRLWDADTGKQLRVFEGHTDAVLGACFSPDGKRVLSGGADKTVRLWDADTGKELRKMTGHPEAVFRVAFGPEGQALSGGVGTMRLWDLNTGQQTAVFSVDGGYPIALAYSAKAGLAATYTWNRIRLWDLEARREVRKWTGHGHDFNKVCFSPDGTRLLTPSAEGTVHVWDVKSGTELKRILAHTETINESRGASCAAFSFDGKRIVSGGAGVVRVWDAESGEELRKYEGHTGVVTDLEFFPDGKRIASASEDGTARVWRVPNPDGAR